MASTQLTWNNGTTGNRKTWTFSFWVKRNKVGAEQVVWTTRYNASNNHLFRFNANDTFSFKGVNSADGTIMDLDSNEVYRDTSGWYHFVLAVDSTQATAANRAKVYVNGVQITSFATADYGAQNQNFEINEANNQVFWVGSENSQNYFEGLLSYFAFVDGTQEAPTIFGETDSTTGSWKIKTTITPSSAWGTNGFLILKDGNSVTDSSSNSNNFAVNAGTLTDAEDCPSNVFATLNPLVRSTTGTYSQGNNTWTDTGGNYVTSFSTLGLFKGQGKYYCEFKVVSGSSVVLGIADLKDAGVYNRMELGETRYLGEYANSYGYQMSGTFYYSGNSTSSGWGAYTSSNVVGMAVDMDNMKLYYHIDGTYQETQQQEVVGIL